ncbi:MAG: zinc ribbon domain-containing protein [Defluviitaleaceae bacterium]|nr:zinc ribbon domain-containing protein [Defluviitaleaceae bacterium]
MFCSKCGHQNPAGTGFCSGCGATLSGGASAPQGGAPTQLGAELASGNGIASNATLMLGGFWGGMAVLSVVLAFVLGTTRIPAINFGWGVATPAMTIYDSWFTFWIIVAVIELIIGVLVVLSIRKTKIAAHEGGITGVGLSQLFMAGDPRTFNFTLNYKDINLSGTGHQLIIATGGTKYITYTSNAQQIREIAAQRK